MNVKQLTMNIKSKNMQTGIQVKKKGRNEGMMKSCRDRMYINCDRMKLPTGYMVRLHTCNGGLSIPTVILNANTV
jgi:hypothetical protein